MGAGISRKALSVFIYIFIYVACHFKYHHCGCQIDGGGKHTKMLLVKQSLTGIGIFSKHIHVSLF